MFPSGPYFFGSILIAIFTILVIKFFTSGLYKDSEFWTWAVLLSITALTLFFSFSIILHIFDFFAQCIIALSSWVL